MNPSSFDRMAKLFADRRLSRRAAVRQGGAGLAAGALATTGLASAARAQEATPAPAEGAGGQKVAYLFVQSFRSGTIAPKEGADGTYTLTLEQGLGQTIYFSDRPERIVGAAPTAQFLPALGFSPDNPPNAALVVEAASGETEIAVLELTNPTYDEATHTATYDVTVLAEWERTLGVGLTETPTDLAGFGDSFGAAHLFIDDCPDLTMCYTAGLIAAGPLPGGAVGTCWSWALCVPCDGRSLHDLEDLCNGTYPDQCVDICVVR